MRLSVRWLEDVDVLIVGGGLAGLRAAYEARQSVDRVRVVTKGVAGRSGASAVASGGFAAVMPACESSDSVEAHVRDTVLGGHGINDRRLVGAMCEEAGARLEDLVKLGARFEIRDGRLEVRRSSDHTAARSAIALGYRGTELTVPLRAKAADVGVEFLDHLMVIDILVQNGSVAGVLALDPKGDELLVLPARAVILATGGAGQLYAVTSNPGDLTGDGYALALRAGAILVDMEFYQFLPWRVIAPIGGGRKTVQMYTFAAGARLVNALGEAFMRRYDPVHGDATTRDVAARAVYSEIRGNRGVHGGVRVDLSGVAHEEFARLNPALARLVARHGLALEDRPLIVAPEAHFCMGGVKIEPDGSTSVPRLWAAGEVAGGTHGANRLGDNALPETQVFGARAGMAAAEAVKSGGSVSVDRAQIGQRVSQLEARWGGEPKRALPVGGIRQRLRHSMWIGAGIVRTAKELEGTLRSLDTYEAELAEMTAATAVELNDLLEAENLCLVGRVLCHAALARHESRGAHARSDFPSQDDRKWRRRVAISANPAKRLRVELLSLPDAE
ncbi:MAG: hypothetical protein A3G80_06055 [Betaproteobacteria bacterium RIFCSPLOWO2_12_FULL_62_13b]|nr:MAG: hypothetical protein A3G80_06055 [Betaproteobacteria bacterium RIFCSPLOWO2_12_FULL_62_13b]